MSAIGSPDGPGNGAAWVRQRHGRCLVYRRRQTDPLLAAVLPEPERLFASGEPIRSPWRGPASDSVRVSIAGQPFFFKRYNCLGPLYRLKNALRPSRARHSFLAAARFGALGIPTPVPLLCLEERAGGTLGRSYLLTELIEGAESLWSLWPQLPPALQAISLEQMGTLIGRLHRCGVLHGDLNWRNLLGRPVGEGLEFFLIDLDRVRFCRRPQPSGAARDLRHFLRDLGRHRAGSELAERFLDRWTEEAGFAAVADLASLLQEVPR